MPDATGNLTNDSIHTYGFDAENKIASVDSVSGVYSYDGDGNRVRKNFASGEKVRMVYSVGELIAEYDVSNGSLKKEYIYAAKGLVATIEPSDGTRYVTADHLGSPRVITNSSGSVISRHDYLPFGEELFAGTGGRTTAQGYSASDGVRQHFTLKERDNETGLDFSEARYYASTQGRFTGIDRLQASARPSQPQTWSRYSYCINNPLVYVDPSGLIWGTKDLGNGRQDNVWFETEKEMKDAGYSAMTNFLLQDPNGGWISFDRNSDFYEHVSDFAVANGLAQGTTSFTHGGIYRPKLLDRRVAPDASGHSKPGRLIFAGTKPLAFK